MTQVAAQPTGTPQAGETPPAAPDGTPPGTPPPDAGDTITIRKDMLAGVSPTGDFGNVIHMAKQYMVLRDAGYGELAETAKQKGLDAHAILSAIQQQEDPNAQQAPPQFGPQPGQQPPYPQVQQGFDPLTGMPYAPAPGQVLAPDHQPMTAQTLQQAMKEHGEQLKKEFTGQLKDLQGKQDAARTQERASAEEFAAYDSTLAGMGFERKPQKLQIGGREVEIDPHVDMLLRPAMQNAAQDLWQAQLEAEIGPNHPEYRERLYGPIPPGIVQAAAERIAPHLTTFGQAQAEAAARQQEIIPSGTNAAEPGGRAQTDLSKATDQEQMQVSMANARQHGLIRTPEQRNQS